MNRKTIASAPAAAKTEVADAAAKTTGKAAETLNEEIKSEGWHGVYQRLQAAQDDVMSFFNVPSWKRTLVAFVTYIAGCAGVAWAGTTLVEMLMTGALGMGCTLFISTVIAIIAAVLIAWYGHKVVMRVAGAVLTGEADQRALDAYDATRAMLSKLNPFSWGSKADKAAA